MSALHLPETIVYPDSDGNPMADNTLQYEWISILKWELEALFANDSEVFVAGDLLWYPVEGHPEIRIAPDALVAFGRPKGYRGSYRQWQEGNIAPQVVFEVLSPGNRSEEMSRKFDIYQRYGVEEYYIYDPDHFGFSGWLRSVTSGQLRLIDPIQGWISPRLGVRFDAPGDRELMIYRPDGVRFRNPLEIRLIMEQTERERDQAEAERDEATRERDEAEAERDEATRERDEATRERDEATRERDEATRERDRLAAKLRELGIDPASLK